MKNVAVIVGSLRTGSINRALAAALMQIGTDGVTFTLADIGALPHYNDDLWADTPPAVTAFKDLIAASDGVLFVTPEYNRGLPGLVKNAVDWASRPYGKGVWVNKPVAICGTSPGSVGTAVSQSWLRSSLVICDCRIMGNPEMYIQTKPGMIAPDHTVPDEKTRAFFASFLAKFAKFIG